MYLFFILFFTILPDALHSMNEVPRKSKSRSSSSSSGDKKDRLRISQGSCSPPANRHQIVKLGDVPEQTIMSDYRPGNRRLSSPEYPRPQTIKKTEDISFIAAQNNGRSELLKSQELRPDFTHGFLVAVVCNDIKKIRLYLSDDFFNPNDIVDQNCNTCFHIAAQNNNFEVLRLLLEDPRPNACLLNNDKKRADQLLQKPELLFECSSSENGYILWSPDYTPEITKQVIVYNNYYAYKRRLFARYTLNNTVATYAQKIFPAYSTGHFDEDVIGGTVEKIESDIKKDTEKQDTSLPTESQLPACATKSFITKQLYLELAVLSRHSK